jgi:alkanesulfonate monooxygenase SsuD/methylene tetrahydromethanopterin reductase-like flavin-dependent oxidoreductase (luciferase family)
LKFGATTVPNRPWAELAARWRELDATPRVESIWVPDHVFKGWYECWATLAGVAHETQRVQFGPLVSPATSHEPVRLARAAITLEDASGGRVELGLGSGGASKRFEGFVAAVVEELGERRIPITIGGAGETALRVAARFADRWNYSPGREDSREDARRRGRELNAHLDELTERPILRSALIAYPFAGENGTPFDDLVAAWANAGFEELILDPARVLGEG